MELQKNMNFIIVSTLTCSYCYIYTLMAKRRKATPDCHQSKAQCRDCKQNLLFNGFFCTPLFLFLLILFVLGQFDKIMSTHSMDHLICNHFSRIVREIWFEKYGSRNLVREKWCFKSGFFFWFEKSGWPDKKWVYTINPQEKNPSLRNHFSRNIFLEKWLQIKWLNAVLEEEKLRQV